MGELTGVLDQNFNSKVVWSCSFQAAHSLNRIAIILLNVRFVQKCCGFNTAGEF